MKTYKQRTEAILAKAEKKAKRKSAVTLAVVGICAAALLLVLFTPYNTEPPDVSMYRGSPYYGLIQKLNKATYTPPEYVNNFHKWSVGAVRSFLKMGGAAMAPGEIAGGTDSDLSADGMPEEEYVEVTDNQVQGVVEADIFKRSDKHVYYLRGDILYVYSIAGEASSQVAVYDTAPSEEGLAVWTEGTEMYLSQDCTTITLVQSYIWKTQDDNGTQIRVISLDVTDPENITQTGCIYMDGNYLSSRMVDGKLLLLSTYRPGTMDFSDESTFLPQIGTPGNMQSIAAEDILSPEEVTSTRYTVVCKLDSKTLTVEGSAAFLSYSDTIYVSKNAVYTTRSFRDIWEDSLVPEDSSCTYTEVTGINYSGDKMKLLGTVTVEGSVKNQYSLDEYEGILRVVTSLNYWGVVAADETFFYNGVPGRTGISTRNASLYCIDITTWEIIASVEQFAPDGETAESVRFDGDTAYVCTAEVVTLTDPVYFFDLSDLTNITWKDTGIIDGYSSSLVNFGNGNLLGIGFDASGGLKIEIYEETADGVQSVCAYENPNAVFSSDYKSYFIDRENQLVGLGLNDYGSGTSSRYLLLYFDGYALRELVNTPLAGNMELKRAFLADGWFYMLGDDFLTEKLW